MFFGRFFALACLAIWFFYSQIDAVAFSRFFEFDLAGNLKKVLSADNCYTRQLFCNRIFTIRFGLAPVGPQDH